MSEQETERRLAHEARTVNLGVIPHRNICMRDYVSARVEVTYQRENDVEHCGYFTVLIPYGLDPWTTARDLVEAKMDKMFFPSEYLSVDDIFSI